MKRGKGELTAILVILGLTVLIMNPGIWLTCFGVVLEIGIFCAVARIIARLLFGRSLYEIIFGRRDDK